MTKVSRANDKKKQRREYTPPLRELRQVFTQWLRGLRSIIDSDEQSAPAPEDNGNRGKPKEK